jgi:hypothetical protein
LDAIVPARFVAHVTPVQDQRSTAEDNFFMTVISVITEINDIRLTRQSRQ